MTEKPNKKTFCGYIALAGVTNAGKSSLLNAIANEKISIISPKPQTTRTVVYGVVTRDDRQAILVDTPGAFGSSAPTMQTLIKQQMFQGLYEGQIILLVIDAVSPGIKYLDPFFDLIAKQELPLIVAINKVDLLKNKDDILPLTDKIIMSGKNAGIEIDKIAAVSAVQGKNVKLLRDNLLAMLPEAPFSYAKDVSNINKDEFVASEMLREQVFLQLHKEIPFGVNVVCDLLEEKDTRSSKNATREAADKLPPKIMKFINLTLLIRKEQHKAIVLGAKGAKMKLIATKTRLGLEQAFSMKVMLTVRVKVAKNTASTLAQQTTNAL